MLSGFVCIGKPGLKVVIYAMSVVIVILATERLLKRQVSALLTMLGAAGVAI